MKIGFTGTRKGMTEKQKSYVSFHLWHNSAFSSGEVHHGDCVGADAEFHYMATKLGCAIIKHPASNVGNQRANCLGGIELKAKPPLERNHDIVDTVNFMIAAPGENHEVLRSGTWATIRYARKVGKKLVVIYPNGNTEGG